MLLDVLTSIQHMFCRSSPAVVTFLVSETKLFPSPLRSTPHQHYCLKLLVLQGRQGFTRQPKNSKRAHFKAQALQPPSKFHERTTKREKKERSLAGERKKNAKFWTPTLRGTPPFGAVANFGQSNFGQFRFFVVCGVRWCTGVLVYWCTGALVHWCIGVGFGPASSPLRRTLLDHPTPDRPFEEPLCLSMPIIGPCQPPSYPFSPRFGHVTMLLDFLTSVQHLFCRSSLAVLTFMLSEIKLVPSPLRSHTVWFASDCARPLLPQATFFCRSGSSEFHVHRPHPSPC